MSDIGRLRLSGKVGERFMVGDDMILTILSVSGNQVRLEFEAPKSIKVFREDLYNRGVREIKPGLTRGNR
jgi:carbon storage regulator